MINQFPKTTELIDKYNTVIDKIMSDINQESTPEEDEFMTNFCIYLAHALLKDYRCGGTARKELLRCAKILQDAIEE